MLSVKCIEYTQLAVPLLLGTRFSSANCCLTDSNAHVTVNCSNRICSLNLTAATKDMLTFDDGQLPYYA